MTNDFETGSRLITRVPAYYIFKLTVEVDRWFDLLLVQGFYNSTKSFIMVVQVDGENIVCLNTRVIAVQCNHSVIFEAIKPY